jgi:hypothetical protein
MYVCLKYAGHIAVLTGKTKETIDIGKTNSIADIISILDERHAGFQDIFMPQGKVFNFNTGIYVRRVAEPTVTIIDENQKVKEGDTLYFW